MFIHGNSLSGLRNARGFVSRVRQKLRKARTRFGELWFYSGLMFILNRGGDVVNVIIGLWLVPHFISQDDLGALLPLMAVGTFFSAPLGIILLPVGKFLNTFIAWGETGKAKALLQDTLVVVGLFAIALVAWMFRAGDAILLRLQVEDRRLLWPIVGFALIACIHPKLQGAQQAMKLFKSTLLPPLLCPLVRLTGMLIMLPTIGALGYLLAQLSVSLTTFTITAVVVFSAMRRLPPRQSYRAHWGEMLRYSLPLLAMTFAVRIQAPVELFVIRHRLPTVDSAGFYFATLFGVIPTFFTNVLMPYLQPLVSERFERGESTHKLFVQPMVFNLIIGIGFACFAAIAMPYIFKIPGPWYEYGDYSRFVWQVSLIQTLKTSFAIFKTHEHACRRFRYMFYVVPIYLLESAVLYGLPAWSLARPYVPESLWLWVNQFATPDLQRFVAIMIAAHLLCFLGTIFHISMREFKCKKYK